MNSVPLVVDLDGTLIHSDMLHESTVRVGSQQPGSLLRLPVWLARGKQILKQNLSQRFTFDAASLPYNLPLLHWLKEQRATGRLIVLCSASHQDIVQRIADHLGLFDHVMASDTLVNLAGRHKAQALVNRFGEKQFDYIGNSRTDLPVWKVSRRAVVVSGSESLVERAREVCEVQQVFAPAPASRLTTWRKALRVHQWLKNALLFVPIIAAHRLHDALAWQHLLLALAAFSLCASSVYIANDLLDLESDRQHPRKRLRPFAAGTLPISQGVVASVLLLLAGFGLGALAGTGFLAWLGIYFVVTTAYSFKLKQLILLDCLVLAFLYTVRVIAGAAAAQVPVTFWLLAFSGFLFLSLAFVKRYAELQVQLLAGKTKAHGRGYLTTDAPLVQMVGVTSGYAAVLVLALYLNSDAVVALYATPTLVWCTVPVMVFWITWMWLRAHRGEMHDDPVVFAIRDRASMAAGAVFIGLLALGSVAW